MELWGIELEEKRATWTKRKVWLRRCITIHISQETSVFNEHVLDLLHIRSTLREEVRSDYEESSVQLVSLPLLLFILLHSFRWQLRCDGSVVERLKRGAYI